MTSYLRPIQNGSVTQKRVHHWRLRLGCRAERLFPSHGQKRRLVRDNLSLTWIILGFVRRVSELNVKVDVEDSVAVMVPWDWGAR